MDHWARIARHWALLGPPLRPSADDVQVAADLLAAWSRAHARVPRALLLGVTPELATLAWPAGSSLLAIDRAPAMIGAIFPRGPGRDAVVGEWLALPRGARTVDLVLGDGCLSCLEFPADYRALAAELDRVLDDGGRVALRLFAAPARRESVGAVADALAAGAIAGFHAFKWRLAMAVASGDNVRVADVWRAFAELVPDRAALAGRSGWPPSVIDTIDAYRDSAIAYSFPTADLVRAAFAPELVDVACHVPGYELGDRCPTLVWRRR